MNYQNSNDQQEQQIQNFEYFTSAQEYQKQQDDRLKTLEQSLSEEQSDIQIQQIELKPWTEQQKYQFIQYIQQQNITKLNQKQAEYLQNLLQKSKQQIYVMFNQTYIDEKTQKQIIAISYHQLQTHQQISWKQIAKQTHKNIKSVIHSYESYYDNCPQEILDKIKYFIDTSLSKEIDWRKMMLKLKINDSTLKRLVQQHQLMTEKQWDKEEIEQALKQGQEIINNKVRTLKVKYLQTQYPQHKLYSIIQYMCLNPKQIKFLFD